MAKTTLGECAADPQSTTNSILLVELRSNLNLLVAYALPHGEFSCNKVALLQTGHLNFYLTRLAKDRSTPFSQTSG
jgi:hypothetical protein